MALCPNCGHHLMRVHRNVPQRILYSEVFRCGHCRTTSKRIRAGLSVRMTFYFSRFTHCIRCGSPRIERMEKRDHIDSMSHHPFSHLFHLTGAPLKKCPACRLQYYDWRPLVPEERNT